MIPQNIAMLIASGSIEDAKRIEAKYKAGEVYKAYPGSVNTELWLKKFITQDPHLLDKKDMIRILAPLDDSVLILGETGTGKEIFARALHGNRDGDFVSINCTGLPDYLLESELFGHVRGAFTGALSDKKGLLVEAQNGTVLFDEIGDMPLAMQAKLLRVIQFKEVRPVGSNKHISINCRFVFATNKNVEKLVKEGQFRDDLYYRIAVITILIPKLCERNWEDTKAIILSLDPSGKYLEEKEEYLKMHRNLPGNVRELQQKIRQWQIERKLKLLQQREHSDL